MAESTQNEFEILSKTINALERALPLIMTPSQHGAAIHTINIAMDILKDSKLSPELNTIATTVKILNNGESPLLATISYQGFILELLESLQTMKDQLEQGSQLSVNLVDVRSGGEFLIRLSGRVTKRYKMRVTFNPEYEAKSIRAFMLAKELQPFVRFLSMSPDISGNQNPNLDNGFELDLLSMETAQSLHKIAGGVLEVINVQMWSENKSQPVLVIDPPSAEDSYNEQVQNFLAN